MSQKLKAYIAELRELVSDNWFLDNPNDDVNEEVTRLLDLLERAVQVAEFYANGAGLDIVDEGRNYMPSYKAYENCFSSENHIDKEVGALAQEFLETDPKKERGDE